MSYNGSGTFVINTAGQPVVANTVISATVFNALTADLATGLSTAITKDGQTTITANIPFGSNKITGLGAGTAATDAANLSQVQSTAAKLVTVTGTDTLTGTMSPALGAYAAGQLFYFIAGAANTGAMTINIDGLGAKSITRDGSTALIANDVLSGEIVVICYDGTRFQMINAANSFGNTTINGTLTVTGNAGFQANVSITSALSVGGVFAVTGASTLTGTATLTANPVLNGGTANGVLYLNGSKVATSGSALVFDGTNLGIGRSPSTKLDVEGQIRGLTRYYLQRPSDNYSLSFASRWDGTTGSPLTGTAGINMVFGSEEAGSSVMFATGNVERARIDSSGNFGVGVTTVNAKIEARNGYIRSYHNSASINAGYGYEFSTDGGGTDTTIALISALQETASARTGAILFQTSNAGAPAERARITAGGDIQIRTADSYLYSNATSGGTTIDCGFQFISSTKNLTFWSNNTERGRFDSSGSLLLATTTNPTTGTVARSVLSIKQLNDTSFTSGIQLEANADTSFFGIGYNGTSFQIGTTYRTTGGYKPIVFVPGGTTTLTLTTSATAQFANSISVGGATPTTSGAGITFPATQSASTDANTLDDYEEGTWTPSLGGTATYTTQRGKYTKIGRAVYVTGIIVVNLIGTGSTTVISGLPFTTTSQDSGGIQITYLAGGATNVVFVTGYANDGDTRFTFYSLTAAAATTGTNAIFGNGTQVNFSGMYFV